MTSPPTTRCDLHLHSSASLTTGQWFSQYFQAPESYADPREQYDLCRSRGMSLVTLTDHDSIDGGLQLVGLPGFFLSVEVSTRFPENDCAVHVLVFDVTPAQHAALQRLRGSVYDVCRFLRRAGLAHSLPHPLMSPNWTLDSTTLEKCLVLFPTIESVNGLVDRRIASDTAHLLAALTPELLGELAARHDVVLRHGSPARHAITAGSDDHGQRRSGSICTEVEGTHDAASFLERVMQGGGRAVGKGGELNAMAVCIQQTTYKHFRRGAGGPRERSSLFVDAMDVLAGRARPAAAREPRGRADILDALIQAAARARIAPGPALDVLCNPQVPSDDDDRVIVDAVARLSDTLAASAAQDLCATLVEFDLYGVLASINDLAAAVGVAAPLLFAADHFGRQEQQAQRVWAGWTATPRPPRQTVLAVFSDAPESGNGVAKSHADLAASSIAAGRRIWFARCDAGPPSPESTALPYPALARFPVPFYAGMEICIPSLAATVDRLWGEQATHVEVATPGPMGLVGLIAAQLLRLPVTATFHTDFSDMLRLFTPDPTAASLAHVYLGWFYRRVDRVFILSEAARPRLAEYRVEPERIALLPSGIDPSDFSPEHRSASVFSDLGIDVRGRPVVLSVGRLSAEKNVALVIAAVRACQGWRQPPLLVVVGDGPLAASLRSEAGGVAFVSFVGPQSGLVLRELYASASAFVFASEIDTLGLVNLEALASGLPLLVPAGSAISGRLRHGDEAHVYDLDAGSLAQALGAVLNDPDYAARLSAHGRRASLAQWQSPARADVWQVMAGARSDLALA
jgi:glycosyltransferase involved in cell wall biosynthesis